MMATNNYVLADLKKFITDRLQKRNSLLKSIKANMSEVVSSVIDLDEEFIEKMEEMNCCYSNDDEMSFIKSKTSFDLSLIELILWHKYCFEMSLGMWEYDVENCIRCGGGPLHFKEIPGEDYVEKLVCQQCGNEMVIGEDRLEQFSE